MCKSIKSSCTHPSIQSLIHRLESYSFLGGGGDEAKAEILFSFFFPNSFFFCARLSDFLHFTACELVFRKWTDHNCEVSIPKM